MLSNAVPKFPNGLSLREEREHRKAEDEKALRECYAAVDARDLKVCRISGIRLSPLASEPRKRLEHHHMRPRSVAPAERANTANILTVSAFVHGLLTAHRLHVEGDADLRDAEGRFVGVQLSTLHDEGWRLSRLV